METKDHTFVFILKNKKQINLNIGILKEKYNHLYYYEMKMEEHISIKDFDMKHVKSHCVLLPRLNSNGLPSRSNVGIISSMYTIISDDWKELDGHKKLK